VLILLGVESLKVVPAKTNSLLETFEAMKHCAIVIAITFTGVAVSTDIWMVRLELCISLLSINSENYHHEGAHQVASIRYFGVVLAVAVMVDARVALKVFALEQLRQFSAEAMRHCQVQWAKVFVERHVDQVIVNVEKESVVDVLGWLHV